MMRIQGSKSLTSFNIIKNLSFFLLCIILVCITCFSCQNDKTEGLNKKNHKTMQTHIIMSQNKDTLTFNEVKIGKQIWMQRNLNLSVFRNGDTIFHAKTKSEWDYAIKNKIPAWSYYENKEENGIKYGKLYNWYAVSDSRCLAPKGWEIPSKKDWEQFINYFGGWDIDSYKIMSKNFWNGTNDKGFNAVAGGGRFYNGRFNSINEIAFFWSSTSNPQKIDNIIEAAFCFMLSGSLTIFTSFSKNYGLSVRCIKE